MAEIQYLFLIIGILLLFSVIASKAEKFGVPALLIFLFIGMLAGFDGPIGIYFADPKLAQLLGVAALIFILFSGGLDTDWRVIRPVIWSGLSLSTLAVLITAGAVGVLVYYITQLSWLESLLFGAIVSSTDAAAVFSILRSRNLQLRQNIQAVVELESASNDPMAVFLTLGLIRLITMPNASWVDLIIMFFMQMTLGLIAGVIMGRVMPSVLNRIHLDYRGLYPVLTIALVLLTYSLTDFVGGSGFLAVYVAALIMGNTPFVYKQELMQFHEGLTWVMQIAMFLTLGLLVFPSELVNVVDVDLLIALFLIFFARPLAIYISLLSSGFAWREKAMITWLGLRGAVPIILATFPLVAGLPKADLIFNFVFFIVLTSVLLQGTLAPFISRILKVEA